MRARTPQLAVGGSAFVGLDGDAGARDLVELDAAGRAVRTTRLRLPAESRAVGVRDGVGVVWRDGDQLAVARVKDGALGPPSRFGTRAHHMCEGVASNDKRWGVGWREADNRVWIVFGPTGLAGAAAVDEPYPATAGAADWCAVVSGDDQIVLFWRDGARMQMNFCGPKKCRGLAPNIPAEIARATILSIGCLRDGCGFVTRTGAGAIQMSWIGAGGSLRWTKPLPGARADTTASLLGVGDRQLAVSYLAGDGARVLRVDRQGNLAQVWRGDAPIAPALMWSRDRLLLAYTHAGALRADVVALPR